MKQKLLLVFAFLSVTFAFAQGSFTSDGISYNITSSNTVEVSQHINSGSVEIPSTVKDVSTNTIYNVTAIGVFAFYQSNSLISVNIPNSVTSLGNLAFWDCSSLTSINIPNSVTTIGDQTFLNCSSLSSINIPNSVTAIGGAAFSGCSSLTTINIPNSVTAIGNNTFLNCSSLTNITIPNSVTSLGNLAFYNCSSLTNVTIDVVDPSTITLGADIFIDVPANILTVPVGSVTAYKATPPWNSFGTIEEETTTWTGTTDTDWNTASNWSSGLVPTITGNIVIPNVVNKPEINTSINAVAEKITINLNSSITVNAGGSLIVEGNLTNNGTLTVNSSEFSGTLIVKGTATGNVTYKKNIPDTNWHFVTSPVSGDTYDNIIASNNFAKGSGPNIGFSGYSNNIGLSWYYAQLSTSGVMNSGMGLSVKLATAGELSFTGTVNTSDIFYAISTGTRTNFNFIGNPFTAYINSDNFIYTNKALLEKTIWLWDGTDYVTYNAANPIKIAPGQGFFVEAGESGTVTFSSANQSHLEMGRPAAKTSFELFVENKTSKKSTKVFYITDKTTGFDNGYDSKMFSGTKSNFGVFTELISDNKGNKLAIQSLPNTDLETMVIPVGIIADAGQEVTFSVNSQNFPSDIKIYLEDRIANTFTDISETNHKVLVENTAKNSGQFYIHTTAKNLENAPIQQELQNVSIYKSENNSITISGLQTDNASLNVFSVLGQKIISTSFKSTGSNIIQLPKTSTGVYIIELNSDLGTINKKIILE